ncbi:hypothetical protein AQJ30_02865 [Streptomyces longwoodensis]|uniref:Uncharacterized protein n=1 Tax=Streptomyces longwoodensis TaxID=68231 RepID=A0A117QQI0_9ACTN|nr:hypothetical protein AQJ30_02865 [Streptomyces longwoodensis]
MGADLRARRSLSSLTWSATTRAGLSARSRISWRAAAASAPRVCRALRCRRSARLLMLLRLPSYSVGLGAAADGF